MIPIHLRLYITGRTVSAEGARAALAALESRLIADHGSGAIVSEIVDVLETPEIAARDDVFATPTLARLSPGPGVRLFGDLSSVTRVLAGLGLGETQVVSEHAAARAHHFGQLIADRPTMVEDDGLWPIITSGTSSSPAAVLE